MPARTRYAALLAAALLAPLAAHAAGTRTHVSNAGSDANTAFSCDSAHPCRTFAAALTVTTPGGEILAIDSSGYGKVVVDRSVSIIAAPGVFAGIGVGAGGNATGVEIATAGVEVVLRGLTLTGQGGTHGINMSNGASLSVENCVVSNFPGGGRRGLFVGTAAAIRIVNSLFRDNYDGALISGGATASISESQFFGSTDLAVWVSDQVGSGVTTTAHVDRSVASGGGGGFAAQTANAGNRTRLFVSNSVASNNSSLGVMSFAPLGNAYVSVRSTELSGNANSGLYVSGAGAKLVAGDNTIQDNYSGMTQSSAGVLESAGGNVVRNNYFDLSGVIAATFSRM